MHVANGYVMFVHYYAVGPARDIEICCTDVRIDSGSFTLVKSHLRTISLDIKYK